MPIRSAIDVAVGSMPERPANESVIEACCLLEGLPPHVCERLAANSFMAYADKGEMIWMAGAPAEFCSVVGIGFVKMSKGTPHGQEVILELLGPGQAFGLMAAIEGRDFPLSATAVTNCWYLKIPARELVACYEESPALKDRIVRTVGRRLRKAQDMAARMSSGKAEERIAAILFILADSYGRETEGGLELTVPLTRQDVAEMAGTTMETAIRVLSKWQKEGFVSTVHRCITILEADRLAEILQG
ncbi:MAG TPA: Crp/Fnr family transcriptional regulator [Fimbriimonadaceae bacterium]|nr:Crp/Fnr family transcriptional regulator [Fimbriimonadaceae bacterium]